VARFCHEEITSASPYMYTKNSVIAQYLTILSIYTQKLNLVSFEVDVLHTEWRRGQKLEKKAIIFFHYLSLLLLKPQGCRWRDGSGRGWLGVVDTRLVTESRPELETEKK